MKRMLFFLCVLASPALADVTSPSGKTVECYCTDSTGGRVEMGETICLQVSGRMFTAQCQMSLNSPMWREISDGCASSSLTPGARQFPAGPMSSAVELVDPTL